MEFFWQVTGFFSEPHVGPRKVALVQTVNPSSDSPCYRNSQDVSPYWSFSLPLLFWHHRATSRHYPALSVSDAHSFVFNSFIHSTAEEQATPIGLHFRAVPYCLTELVDMVRTTMFTCSICFFFRGVFSLMRTLESRWMLNDEYILY